MGPATHAARAELPWRAAQQRHAQPGAVAAAPLGAARLLQARTGRRGGGCLHSSIGREPAGAHWVAPHAPSASAAAQPMIGASALSCHAMLSPCCFLSLQAARGGAVGVQPGLPGARQPHRASAVGSHRGAGAARRWLSACC